MDGGDQIIQGLNMSEYNWQDFVHGFGHRYLFFLQV